jgi:NADH:ubiquinone oxidoreductase subunit E
MNLQKTCNSEELSLSEKLQFIDKVIEDYMYDDHSLIQILHVTQNMFGYLPMELQSHIAQKLDVPLSRVSGVVSFYKLFTTTQKGKYIIKVCLGTACYVRGGKRLIDRFEQLLSIKLGETSDDQRYTLELTRCMGACGLAPAIEINGVVHMQVNPDRLIDLLDELE